MKLSLSNRLLACCSLVHKNDCVADIGCDHGYLGLWLLKNNIASSVIAADVNELPLQSAKRNAVRFGMDKKMSFYLSDGVKSIPHEFDCMVCAGMGADTIISILEGAPWLKSSHYRLILQCQSKRPELRRYLNRNHFRITEETLAKDGKFIYTVIEAQYAEPQTLEEWEYYCSKALLNSGSDLLPPFLERVIHGLTDSLRGLQASEKANMETVITRLQKEWEQITNGNCTDNSRLP